MLINQSLNHSLTHSPNHLRSFSLPPATSHRITNNHIKTRYGHSLIIRHHITSHHVASRYITSPTHFLIHDNTTHHIAAHSLTTDPQYTSHNSNITRTRNSYQIPPLTHTMHKTVVFCHISNSQKGPAIRGAVMLSPHRLHIDMHITNICCSISITNVCCV